MQSLLWIIQYFYSCRQLYLTLARKLCVVVLMLFNEINAVAKLSRGINNFFAGSGIKIWGKNEISYEQIYLVTTLFIYTFC